MEVCCYRDLGQPSLLQLDLALNLKIGMDGGGGGHTKAMLAFQFLVLPVQDTSSQLVCVLCSVWVFFTADIKSFKLFFGWLVVRFVVICFCYQCFFKKQVCIPKGKALSGTRDGKFITIQPCCSAAPLRCSTAQADHGLALSQGVGACPGHAEEAAAHQRRWQEHPRSRTCISTSDGIQWVWIFLIWSHTFFFYSNLSSECDF